MKGMKDALRNRMHRGLDSTKVIGGAESINSGKPLDSEEAAEKQADVSQDKALIAKMIQEALAKENAQEKSEDISQDEKTFHMMFQKEMGGAAPNSLKARVAHSAKMK